MFLLISAGELNDNKNNGVIISAMEKLKNPNIHYILCGIGEKQVELQAQVDQACLHENVHFLGYRTDVKELYETADCFVMPSLREGLSRSIMEAVASGLPCIVSKIRCNVDLIDEGKEGFLCQPCSVEEFASAIANIAQSDELCYSMSNYNRTKVKEFDAAVVTEDMINIYK